MKEYHKKRKMLKQYADECIVRQSKSRKGNGLSCYASAWTQDGKFIYGTWNDKKNGTRDASYHAEQLCIRKAKELGYDNIILFTSYQPCEECIAVIKESNVFKTYYLISKQEDINDSEISKINLNSNGYISKCDLDPIIIENNELVKHINKYNGDKTINFNFCIKDMKIEKVKNIELNHLIQETTPMFRVVINRDNAHENMRVG